MFWVDDNRTVHSCGASDGPTIVVPILYPEEDVKADDAVAEGRGMDKSVAQCEDVINDVVEAKMLAQLSNNNTSEGISNIYMLHFHFCQ